MRESPVELAHSLMCYLSWKTIGCGIPIVSHVISVLETERSHRKRGQCSFGVLTNQFSGQFTLQLTTMKLFALALTFASAESARLGLLRVGPASREVPAAPLVSRSLFEEDSAL